MHYYNTFVLNIWNLVLQAQYENLMALARERQKKLSETVQAYVLVREAAELAQWIKDKEQFAQVEDVGEDLEQVMEFAVPFEALDNWQRSTRSFYIIAHFRWK